MEKHLVQHVEEMRRLADHLVHLSHPNVEFVEEHEIIPLKCRTIKVDGYEMSVNFSKSDHKKHIIESLQIQSVYTPFLPFHVVCTVGRAYLGSQHLSFVDFMKNNKKIYCWTVRKRRGKALPISSKSLPGYYEGFEYSVLQPGMVNLYGS